MCPLPTWYEYRMFCQNSTTKLCCEQRTIGTTAYFSIMLFSSPIFILKSSPAIVFCELSCVFYSNFIKVSEQLQIMIWFLLAEKQLQVLSISFCNCTFFFLSVLSYHILHHTSFLMRLFVLNPRLQWSWLPVQAWQWEWRRYSHDLLWCCRPKPPPGLGVHDASYQLRLALPP